MSTLHFTELLPWVNQTYENLCALNKQQKLAHAYLIEGNKGLGKLTLAKHFAHYLLCQSPNDLQPCNECQACQLIAANTHPDIKVVSPQETKSIKIEQIRDTLKFMANTSLKGGRKVIIFSPAESMNINSANALLKALEEPSEGTLILLISHQPASLMATIKSRCQRLTITPPKTETAIAWLHSKNISGSANTLLDLANGAPLRALELADEDALHERSVLHNELAKLLSGESSITEAAQECNRFDISDNINSMMLSVSDILEHNQSQQKKSLSDPELKGLADYLNSFEKTKTLHQCYQALTQAKFAINSDTNPNPLMLLESLFFQWSRL